MVDFWMKLVAQNFIYGCKSHVGWTQKCPTLVFSLSILHIPQLYSKKKKKGSAKYKLKIVPWRNVRRFEVCENLCKTLWKSVRRGYLPGSHVVSSLHLFIHLPLANAESRAKIRHRNKHSWHLPATTTWKFPRSSAADVYGDPRWAPHQQQHTFQLVSPWARSIPLSLPHAILPLLLVFLFNSHLFFCF